MYLCILFYFALKSITTKGIQWWCIFKVFLCDLSCILESNSSEEAYYKFYCCRSFPPFLPPFLCVLTSIMYFFLFNITIISKNAILHKNSFLLSFKKMSSIAHRKHAFLACSFTCVPYNVKRRRNEIPGQKHKSRQFTWEAQSASLNNAMHRNFFISRINMYEAPAF